MAVYGVAATTLAGSTIFMVVAADNRSLAGHIAAEHLSAAGVSGDTIELQPFEDMLWDQYDGIAVLTTEVM